MQQPTLSGNNDARRASHTQNSAASNGFATSNITSSFFLGRQHPTWMSNGQVTAAPPQQPLATPSRSLISSSGSLQAMSGPRPPSGLGFQAPNPMASNRLPSGTSSAVQASTMQTSGSQAVVNHGQQPGVPTGTTSAASPSSGHVTPVSGISAPSQVLGNPAAVSRAAALSPELSSTDQSLALAPSAFSRPFIQHPLSPSASPESHVSRKRSMGWSELEAQRPLRQRPSMPSSQAGSVANVSPISQPQTPVPAPTPPSRATQFVPALDALIVKLHELGKYGTQEDMRAGLLREACRQEDLFYLCLHQLLCQATLGTLSIFHKGFGPSQVAGFAQLQEVLQISNRHIDPVVLGAFSDFPVPGSQLAKNGEFAQYISQVKAFLPILADGWLRLQADCQVRRYPPNASELLARLSVYSITLQKLLFNFIHRQLGDTTIKGWQEQALDYFIRDQYRYLRQMSNTGINGLQEGPDSASDINTFGRGYINLRDRLRYQVVAAAAQPASDRRTSQCSTSPAGHVANPWNGVPFVPSNPTRIQQGSSHIVRDQNGNVIGQFVPISSIAAPQIQTQQPQYASANQGQYMLSNIGGQVTPVRSMYPPQRMPSTGAPSARSNTAPRMPSGQPYITPQRMNVSHLSPVSSLIQRQGFVPSVQPATLPNGTYFPAVQFGAPAPTQVLAHPSPLLIPPLPEMLEQRVNPYTERDALHQAHVRSPISLKANMDGTTDPGLRLYQVFDRFALPPQPLGATCPYFSWCFNVSAETKVQLAEDLPIDLKRPDTSPQRLLKNGSYLCRMRCAQLPRGSQSINPSDWAVEQTTWPNHAFISLNNVPLELRRKTHHGKDLPLDLTSILKEGSNQVTFSIHRDVNEKVKTFAISVELVKIVDHNTALSIPTSVAAVESLTLITRSLTRTSSDDEIELLDPHVSIDLFDPFMSTIFTIPVRGKSCLHRECFDLEAFLQSRTSRTKGGPTNPDEWKCPICKKDARPGSLVIDGFLADVRMRLQEQDKLDTKAILVAADGSWEPKMEKEADGDRSRKSTERRTTKAESEDANATNDGTWNGPTATMTTTPGEIIELDDD